MSRQTALDCADEVIKDLLENGNGDYSGGRGEIARVFEDELWDGFWDSSTDFAPSLSLGNLRFIQEDEYDQHMDEDDKPEGESIYSVGHYVFIE